MSWKTLLAAISGEFDVELARQIDFLKAENKILKSQINGRLRLKDSERRTLAELGKPLGRRILAEISTIVTPDTLLRWHRKLIAMKFDGSKAKKRLGRPSTRDEIREQSVRRECLDKLILFGETSLRHALREYLRHYHRERNHQGTGNAILFPSRNRNDPLDGPIRCRKRLGGLLRYYYREAG